MSRYIDADKIEYEDMLRPRGNGNYEECQIAYRDQIDDIPTADVRGNVKGEWVDAVVGTSTGYTYHEKRCSICGHSEVLSMNFCPHCGADMRGGDAE